MRERTAPATRERFCIIRIGGREYCIDPLAPLLSVLGQKWTLFIIGVLGNERTMRFNELQQALLDISPRTLSDRLKDLEASGLIRRKAYAEVPLRVEYALSAKGEALRESLVPMLGWAEKND